MELICIDPLSRRERGGREATEEGKQGERRKKIRGETETDRQRQRERENRRNMTAGDVRDCSQIRKNER